jgi:hypothetical protein
MEIAIVIHLIFGLLAILGVIIRSKSMKKGSILLLITGIFFPVFMLILIGPVYFVGFMISFDGLFALIPILLLLFGGIICFLEWKQESKNV